MRRAIQLLIAVLVIYVGWCVAKPFIAKYRIEKAVDNIAQYCTLHTVEESYAEFKNRVIDIGQQSKFLDGKLKLEKDEETSAVKASIEYTDEISIFGFKVKDLKFTGKDMIKSEASKVDKVI